MDPNRPPPDPNASNRLPPDGNESNQPPPNQNESNQPPPNQNAPNRGTPAHTAPGRPSIDSSAQDQTSSERSAPGRLLTDRNASERPQTRTDRRRNPSDQTVHRATHGVPKTLPPAPPPGPSHDPGMVFDEPSTSWVKCLYNKDTGEICYRTPKSWLLILSYSAMYLIFLMTFTLVVLYISLLIIKQTIDFNAYSDSRIKPTLFEYLSYPSQAIGLTASPTSEDSVPLIWYKNGEKDGYDKYVKAIEKFLLSNRRKREVSSLGPCGQSPYGYGEKPCIIIRINKKFNWAGRPLNFNSTIAKSAPKEVQAWMRADKTKLWLQCSGYHSYDKEHIGRIKYYPDPPGFDASIFPLGEHKQSPLVAVQISEFTLGISLAIECKLWYEAGPSTFEFLLYVAP